MRKLLLSALCILSTITYGNYTKYGTVLKTISIEGYPDFMYAFWLHPGQGAPGHDPLFSKQNADFFQAFIPKDTIVIDIGAHVGDTPAFYSLLVGPQGLVIAFEPNPSCYEVLEINARLNPSIVPVNKAVTEYDGNYTFYYTDPGLCNGAYAETLSFHPYTIPVEVEGVNLIKWMQKNIPDSLDKISFIKIDTEGYDRYIIRNIRPFLMQYRSLLQCELFIYLNSEEREDLFNQIDAMNYTIFLIAYDRVFDTTPLTKKIPFTKESFLKYQLPTGSIDLLCIPTERLHEFVQ